jgi:hypothetical protein
MSSRGELFITEDVGDYLRKNYPDFKFDRLEVPRSWYHLWNERDFPDSVQVRALDEDNKLVGIVYVNIGFKTDHDGFGSKYITAYVKDAEIEPIKKKYRIRCYIPVESEEEEIYESKKEAERDLESMKLMQPENIYVIEEVIT